MAADQLEKFYGLESDYDPDANHVLRRAVAMAQRRRNYEEMWRANIFAFVAHAIYDVGSAPRQFDPAVAPELQGYFNSKMNTFGFRFTDIRYPLEFAVIMRKMAMEMKNIPDPNWRDITQKDQSVCDLFSRVYEDVLYNESFGEYEMFEAFLNKNVFGTTVLWSRIVDFDNKISEPKWDETKKDWGYDKKTPRIRKLVTSCVDLRHVLFDEGATKPTLEDCDDAIIFEYFSEDRGNQIFGKAKLEALNIKPCAVTKCFQDVSDRMGGDTKLVYEVMHYQNCRTDDAIDLINGKTLKKTPIIMRPFRGEKWLPLSILTDHKVPGCIYGYGEPTILKAFREIKNKNRNLIYDIIKKMSKPTLFVDPLSTFNENEFMFGADIIRVAINDVKPLEIHPDLNPAIELDKMTDNDTILVSGVNIADTSVAPANEKATKTIQRKESQVAVIDLGMSLNTCTGLQRFHHINANLLTLNLRVPRLDEAGKAVPMEVTLKGKQMFRGKGDKSNSFITQPAEGSHTFEYFGEDLVGHHFVPQLEMGNIAVSEIADKAMKMEGMEQMRENAQIDPSCFDPHTANQMIAEWYDFPKEIAPDKQGQGTGAPGQMSPEDKANQTAQQMGAVVPKEVSTANQFKNVQQATVMAPGTPGAAPMGAPRAPASVPAAR